LKKLAAFVRGLDLIIRLVDWTSSRRKDRVLERSLPLEFIASTAQAASLSYDQGAVTTPGEAYPSSVFPAKSSRDSWTRAWNFEVINRLPRAGVWIRDESGEHTTLLRNHRCASRPRRAPATRTASGVVVHDVRFAKRSGSLTGIKL
jgi:hypothetical protein